MSKLKIGWMYPDLLNLHGERGSVQALVRAAENLGQKAEVVRIVDFEDKIPFDTLDMLLFLPGEIKTLEAMRYALRPQEEQLRRYVKNWGTVVAIGTTGLIFGKQIHRADDSRIKGFELLDMTAEERSFVWGDDLHLRIDETKQELIGSQILMADVETSMPFGHTIYGRGNNGAGAEGARWRNLIYTNCLGPLFVKNPWFAEDLWKNILLRKKGISQKAPNDLALASFETTLRFVQSKQKKGLLP